MALSLNLGFDALLAVFFPLALFAVVLRSNIGLNLRHRAWGTLLDVVSLRARKSSHGPFSLQRAYQSYSQYSRLSAYEISRKHVAYSTLGRAHRRLGNKIGYPAKLDKLKYVTDLNAVVTEGIAGLAAKELGVSESFAGHGAELGRVREALKHFVRDWSEEGAEEREKIFRPILDVLATVDPVERKHKKVLVPGAGLGRLAWEISQLGYDTTANELSFFMNLAFRFLLSADTTPTANEHTLRPYAHWFSHQRSNDSLFRAIHFPDAVPRLSPSFRLAESDFLTLSPPGPQSASTFAWSKSSDDPDAGYDYIATLFFIDTSLNALATVQQVHTLLRPGGTWINLGPLLWTSGGHAKLELSLEEVICVAEEIGFVFQENGGGKTRTVECEYTRDKNAMMRWVYGAEFWVATKSK
ncbi:hypothetical protein DXG03_002580 [Asterophora parasitica]|uniref:N2227-domain-containing protein n=1 Tax=Asterophora parasitica TaxID=117018 RepID=A0A9P7G1U1_9AGAR|nr:hypothetical protein DXG03_002580 [Asterophora parasitica]